MGGGGLTIEEKGKGRRKAKRTNSRWSSLASYCVRPDPDNPGGLGAEESGTERTGPTQYLVIPR